MSAPAVADILRSLGLANPGNANRCLNGGFDFMVEMTDEDLVEKVVGDLQR
jgi:hypothetical protein